jgi:hypothetical protein
MARKGNQVQISTLAAPLQMRLASRNTECLWKGLERFVNCGDSIEDYQALGKAFSDFWPIRVDYWSIEQRQRADGSISVGRAVLVGWHPACHKLFLFYRDTLRSIWRGQKEVEPGFTSAPDFLLGLLSLNEEARACVQKWRAERLAPDLTAPESLVSAWMDILNEFSEAQPELPNRVSSLWKEGGFFLVPLNDFQRAFYFLFRQSWRARACPRCKMFFVARRPKQLFCGTVCSAGSRLASKRKWWSSVGAKRRTVQRKTSLNRNRKERKRR